MFTRAELGLVGTAALMVFSRVFGLSLVLPNFRGHYELLADPVWIGVAFGAYGLTMALVQLPWGILSDKIGRRPVLVLTSLLFVAGSLVCAWADNIEWLIAGRLAQGLGAIASVAVAAVGETLPADRRTTGMAMVGIPAGLGFLVGIAAGPALYPLISMDGLFLLTAAMGALAALPLLSIKIAAPADLSAPVRTTGAILALAVAGFTANYLLTTTLFFLPDDDWRVLLPMLVVAFVFVGGASRVFDKRGLTWQPIAVGLVMLTGSAAWFVQSVGVPLFFAGALFFMSHSVLMSTLPSQVSRVAGPSGGRGHGVQNVIAYGGTFLAGPVAGYFAAESGYAFVVAAAVAFVAFAAIWTTRPKPSS